MPYNGYLEIRKEWCKGCNICVSFCPKDVLELDVSGKVINPRMEQCIFCKKCELMCPDLAITVIREKVS